MSAAFEVLPELDAVALGIVEADELALAIAIVADRHRGNVDPVGAQRGDDALDVVEPVVDDGPLPGSPGSPGMIANARSRRVGGSASSR